MNLPPIPVDPVLPENFDDTPNDERSTAELDAWWNKPFAITCGDGSFEVRCLDGGAWDRSTWYGIAPDLPSAQTLAQTKLERWHEMQATPTCMLTATGASVVRMNNRPDQKMTVLKECATLAEASAYIATLARHKGA